MYVLRESSKILRVFHVYEDAYDRLKYIENCKTTDDVELYYLDPLKIQESSDYIGECITHSRGIERLKEQISENIRMLQKYVDSM